MRLAACARQRDHGRGPAGRGFPARRTAAAGGRPRDSQSLKKAVEDLERRMIADALEAPATTSSRPRAC